MRKKKDAAAVALGSKGGRASAKKLTDVQRREKARKAARAKWAKDKRHRADSRLPGTPSCGQESGKLTKREHQIAEYAARGRSNTEIARHFRIAVNTVKKHIGHVFEKLGVSNRTELALLLMNEHGHVVSAAPQLGAPMMGRIMLEAAKEAYDMAEYLARRGQPGDAEGSKPN